MLPQPPLLPPPHHPLPTTCRCRHHHISPLLDLQCASMPAAISGFPATAVEQPPLALPQVMSTHLSLLPTLPSSATRFFCYRCCCCPHQFTSSHYCIPVCSAYQYASIWLFMLFPSAHQDTGVGNSMKLSFSNSVLVRVSTAYQYAVRTGTPAYHCSCNFLQRTSTRAFLN
jgi:hypothetical protein